LSYAITAIAGIGPAMSAKLKALGIRTTEKLLELAATAKDRKILAEKLDISEQTVLRWANLADRMRIKGVREPYAELLKFAGVDTVKELKYRNPAKLAQAMDDVGIAVKVVKTHIHHRDTEAQRKTKSIIEKSISRYHSSVTTSLAPGWMCFSLLFKDNKVFLCASVSLCRVYAVFAANFILRRTISTIRAWVSAAVPRASTNATLCGSRAAIAR